jgi:hypothetical protein
MPYRTTVSIAAAAILAVACVSTEAMAYRGGYRGGVRAVGVHRNYVGVGVHRGPTYNVGVYRGGWRPGYAAGAAAAGAAVGAAAATSYSNYYNSTQCGYAPYQPCN